MRNPGPPTIVSAELGNPVIDSFPEQSPRPTGRLEAVIDSIIDANRPIWKSILAARPVPEPFDYAFEFWAIGPPSLGQDEWPACRDQ